MSNGTYQHPSGSKRGTPPLPPPLEFRQTSRSGNGKKKLALSVFFLLLGAAIFAVPSSVFAFPSYLNEFNTTYSKSGTRLDSCGVCHKDFNNGSRNPYGKDFASNGHNFSAIEPLDSDGDGSTNIEEINGLFMPGLTCQTAGGTSGGPANLLDFVEPNGCGMTNVPPAADAGPDQSVVVGTTVQLNGSGSNDPDGDPLTYQWSIISIPLGSSATFSDATAVNPTITIDLPGLYALQLIVNDGMADSAPDFVNISTENSAPVANAGPDQTVGIGDSVTLDGSGSSDVDGDTLSFTWSVISIPAGSTAVLSDNSAVMPTFTADVAGNYMMQLVVNDGTVDSAPDTITVSTQSGMNTAPVADAGPDQTVLVTQTAMLDGRGSSDNDGDPLTYQWSFVTKPAGSAAILSDSTSPTPDFLVDKPGMYVVQLIVNDGLVNSPIDTVVVDTQNSPPVANAGPDQTVTVGSTVQLDGSQSMDADGDPLTYQWSLTTVPAGSAAMLSDATITNPTFMADVIGIYMVQLMVNDGMVNSAPDTVMIQVKEMNQQGTLEIKKAKWEREDTPSKSKLKVKGKGAPSEAMVTISNAKTGEVLGTVKAEKNGKWKAKIRGLTIVPCRVRAEYEGMFDEKDVKHAPFNCDRGGDMPPGDDDDHDGRDDHDEEDDNDHDEHDHKDNDHDDKKHKDSDRDHDDKDGKEDDED